MIAIPDAVTFYWSDELNRAAIDALLADDGQPRDLTLDEVGALEEARLAAHRVQVEFWQLLHTIGSKVFGEAVVDTFPRARLLTVEEFEGAIEIRPAIKTTWDDRELYLGWAIGGDVSLIAWVYLANRDRELAVGMSIVKDGSWDLGNDLALEPTWTLSDDEWWIPALGEGRPDEWSSPAALAALQATCRDALTRVRSALST